MATGDSEKDRYQRYLCSREWGLLREQVWDRCGGVCERCRKAPMSHVHHLTYVRKYNERLDDLRGLCAPCHEYTHGRRKEDPRGIHVILSGIIQTRLNAIFVFDDGSSEHIRTVTFEDDATDGRTKFLHSLVSITGGPKGDRCEVDECVGRSYFLNGEDLEPSHEFPKNVGPRLKTFLMNYQSLEMLTPSRPSEDPAPPPPREKHPIERAWPDIIRKVGPVMGIALVGCEPRVEEAEGLANVWISPRKGYNSTLPRRIDNPESLDIIANAISRFVPGRWTCHYTESA